MKPGLGVSLSIGIFIIITDITWEIIDGMTMRFDSWQINFNWKWQSEFLIYMEILECMESIKNALKFIKIGNVG